MKIVLKTLLIRVLFGAILMSIVYFIVPIPMLAKKIVILAMAAPITTVSAVFSKNVRDPSFSPFLYMYSRSLSVLDFTRVHLSHTDQKQCQPCDQHAAARNRAENRHSVADLFFFKALHSHIEAVSRQKE